MSRSRPRLTAGLLAGRFPLVIALRLALLVALTGRVLGVIRADAGLPSSDPQPTYQRLLRQAQADPMRADWPALRQAAARLGRSRGPSEGFDPTPVAFELGNGERVAALLTLERLMADHWLDVKSHLLAADLCLKAERPEQARRHLSAAAGLLDAARASGDGRSFATAWRVLSRSEALALADDLGVRPATLEAVERDGQTFWLIRPAPVAPGIVSSTVLYCTPLP